MNHSARAGHDSTKEAANSTVAPRSVITQVSTAGVVEVVWSYLGNSIKMADGMKTTFGRKIEIYNLKKKTFLEKNLPLIPTTTVLVSQTINPHAVITHPTVINPIKITVNLQLVVVGSLSVLLSNGPAADTFTFCRYSSTIASMSVELSSSSSASSLSVFSGLANDAAMHSMSDTWSDRMVDSTHGGLSGAFGEGGSPSRSHSRSCSWSWGPPFGVLLERPPARTEPDEGLRKNQTDFLDLWEVLLALPLPLLEEDGGLAGGLAEVLRRL